MRYYLFLFLFIASVDLAYSQEQNLFTQEVQQLIAKDDVTSHDNLYLFTGSSSIRFWPNLSEVYEGYNVLNRGFGGSTFTDLIHFKEELIFAYRPAKVFIYEGDNDIFKGESVTSILEKAKSLAREIKERLPEAIVFFISPKPSLSRWELREQYKELNYSLQAWASFEDNVRFIDVWTPMCDEQGQVFDDVFVSDGLHMNAKGYEIWTRIVRPFVKEE